MIAFSCAQCGMKLRVKPEFAGRSSRCPTCKQSLVVPAPSQTQANVVAGQVDGTDSSLAKAGVDGGVTLEHGPQGSRSGSKSIQELLTRRAKKDGRYIIDSEIARGGMGVVLRAVDCDIRREVAVKYLLDQADTKKKLRFVEEAQISGQLEHPNVVPVHEVGIDAHQRLFFSMKMVRGRSLAQVLEELRQNPKPSEYSLGRLLNVLVSVCNALAYAHSRGVVHRDLKPANIMVGDFGEVYVMDWGLAKVLAAPPGTPAPVATLVAGPATSTPSALPVQPNQGTSKSSSKVMTSREAEADLTQEGAVLGTPVYMPPEQATGHIDAVDQRSDIYALGAILYEVLTLQPPVPKEGGYLEVLMRAMQGDIVPPEQRSPERARAGKIPRELSAVAMKALAKRPQDRYPDVAALRRDIERFQEGRSVSAKEDTTREILWKFVKRNKAFSATASIALVVLVVTLGFTFKNYHEKEARTRKAVPAFLRAGRLAVNERQFNDALDHVTVAVDFEPDNAKARLFKAQLLVVQQQYTQAQEELQRSLRQQAGDPAAESLLKLCQQAKSKDITTCLAFADLFTQQKEYGLADGVMHSFGATNLEARKKLYDLYRKRIDEAWPSLGSRLSLDASGKFTLNFGDCAQVTDLGPIRGMPLTTLDLGQCRQLRDLTPLHGMPLTWLKLTECNQVRDLAPLHGMPLTYLNLAGSVQVSDLTPLRGMPLTWLSIAGCGQVRDLTPLRGMKLTSLGLMHCTQVSDLTPLKGMPLTSLNLYDCREVSDLAPLRGMPLTSLTFYRCRRVTDLTPLRGMPLTSLCLEGSTLVKDLAPLQGMKLTSFDLTYCSGVQDLTPLRDMPLTSLALNGCQVRDL